MIMNKQLDVNHIRTVYFIPTISIMKFNKKFPSEPFYRPVVVVSMLLFKFWLERGGSNSSLRLSIKFSHDC